MSQSTSSRTAGRSNPDRWGLRLPNLKRRFVPRDPVRSSGNRRGLGWPGGSSPPNADGARPSRLKGHDAPAVFVTVGASRVRDLPRSNPNAAAAAWTPVRRCGRRCCMLAGGGMLAAAVLLVLAGGGMPGLRRRGARS